MLLNCSKTPVIIESLARTASKTHFKNLISIVAHVVYIYLFFFLTHPTHQYYALKNCQAFLYHTLKHVEGGNHVCRWALLKRPATITLLFSSFSLGFYLRLNVLPLPVEHIPCPHLVPAWDVWLGIARLVPAQGFHGTGRRKHSVATAPAPMIKNISLSSIH